MIISRKIIIDNETAHDIMITFEGTFISDDNIFTHDTIGKRNVIFDRYIVHNYSVYNLTVRSNLRGGMLIGL